MINIGLNNILDVTLRDGGYLNNWQFSTKEIDATLAFLYQIGLRSVEIGFLQSPEKTTSLVNGCPASFLADIRNQYEDMNLVCMLNPANNDWSAAVSEKLSHISLIRMPCTSELVESALKIARDLKVQFYDIKISLNLICISSYSYNEIESLLKIIVKSPNIDIVYFADSRGALYPDEVEKIVTLGKKFCNRPLGFHAHNTLGNAVENSDRAFDCGCEWIDATFNGFGLAGGNLSLGDYLIQHQLLPIESGVTEREIINFGNQFLPLKHPPIMERLLLAALAVKNIDPIWSNQLQEKYQHRLNEYLNTLIWDYYKNIDDVFNPKKQ